MRPALISLLAILAVTPAEAQQARPSQAICERAKLPGRSYIECLEKASRDSDRAMNDALARARAVIESHAELAGVQKTRWKGALEEAQGVFMRFRGLECQNVAPYEGARGIGTFEERLACLVDKNIARARDLEARYGR
ncbi:MAG: lysozyme inhibitor LprI family protein [Methyloceanibacter sp.]